MSIVIKAQESTPAPEAPETPASTPESAPVVDPTPIADKPAPSAPASDPLPAAAAPAQAPYEPNLKIRVMDQDFEIDPFMKDIMTDKEKEKQIRSVYEKAFGLDYAKPKHEALQQQYQQFTKGFESLGGMLQENRMQEFLDFWKIPKEKLYEYVKGQLQYEELPPEQKAEEDRKRGLETRARQAEAERSQILEQYRGQLVENRSRELETAISRPDISQVAQEYDTRKGVPGAFKNAVIMRGRYAAATAQKDISVEQAIDEVMTDLGYVAADQAQQPNSLPVVAPVAQKKLPVLPNLGSGGASPVKKTINSLAEMRAIGKQMRES